jgi:hypothetical protein
MRLRFDCEIATTLPSVMVRTAIPQASGPQSGCAPRRAPRSRRISAAKPAAFEPVAISAVTLVGAPW